MARVDRFFSSDKVRPLGWDGLVALIIFASYWIFGITNFRGWMAMSLSGLYVLLCIGLYKYGKQKYSSGKERH